MKKGGKLAQFQGNDDGLSAYGLTQLLTSSYVTNDELQNGLKSLGYDEYLYNNKSRNFVLSIHSLTPVNAKIGDALKNNYQTIALTLLQDVFIKGGHHAEVRDEANYTLFVNQHIECQGTSFVIVNKSNAPLEVNF